jgi:hypothetical protein
MIPTHSSHSRILSPCKGEGEFAYIYPGVQGDIGTILLVRSTTIHAMVAFLRSFLLACLVLSIASCREPADLCKSDKQAEPPIGRYTFYISPLLGRDIYMLDTRDGRLWEIVNSDDQKSSLLRAVPFTNGAFSALGEAVSQMPPELADKLRASGIDPSKVTGIRRIR